MRVRVRPGAGLVARSGDALMVILPGGDDASVDALTGILEQACTTAAAPGRALARQLAGLILQSRDGSVPPFATAAPTEDGWAVMVFGAAEAQLDSGTRLSGREAATWVDRVLPTGFTWLSLGPDGGGTAHPDRHSRLDAGIVPGSGLLLELVHGAGAHAGSPLATDVVQPPASAASQPPPPPPVDSGFRVIPLTPPQLERSPLPITGEQGEVEEPAQEVLVEGILCENGHFNHPNALYCAVDGVSTVHRTRTPVKGPRPSLGVIVADDGQTYSLDTSYVVGRDPDQDPAARAPHTRALRLEDPALSVSRVHAEIQLSGWDVYIVDRGSANGTFVAEGEQGEWTRLIPNQPQLVTPGMRIAFGQRVVTYSTHHQI